MALLHSPICDFNWKAPTFSLPDLAGNSVSFKSAMGKKGLLIAFICNHCPYVQAIIGRLVTDAKILQNVGVQVVAIMSNDYHSYPDDNPKMMKKFAVQHEFTFSYLLDEDQEVARSYKALCTPDFFGLNNKGLLQYRGRLDNAKMGDASNRKTELLNAMLQIAKTAIGPKEQFSSMGCSLKWKSKLVF